MKQLLSPNFFKNYLEKLIMPLAIAALVFFALAIWLALFASPPDYQQGEMVRIMYVHVPSAWMALGIYVFIGICSFISLVWRLRLAYFYAIAAAPIGAVMALNTLVTGSLWGAPIWGAWWVWDARLTSMLILFFLYLAYIIALKSGDDIMRAEKPAAVIAFLGLINVPIVKFSVDLWYSLHQPASILRKKGVSIHPTMLKPLFAMFFAFVLLFLLLLIMRTSNLLKTHSAQA